MGCVLPVNLRQTSPTFRTRPFHGSIRPAQLAAPRKAQSARFPLDAVALQPQAPGLCAGRFTGGGDRWLGQLAGGGQPALSARCTRRNHGGNGLAAGGVCDDQRVDEPVAGEVSSAVRFACIHRSVSGAVCAGDFRPSVRQRPEFRGGGARGPRHGGRGAEFAGPVLHGPGVPGEVAAEGAGTRPRHLATGLAIGAIIFRRLAADRRMARLVPVRTGHGVAVARLRVAAQATARRSLQNFRKTRLSHLCHSRHWRGVAVCGVVAGADRLVAGGRLDRLCVGCFDCLDHRRSGHRT
ncbi:hypothetical protein D3C72_1360820 [compost metagenome]